MALVMAATTTATTEVTLTPTLKRKLMLELRHYASLLTSLKGIEAEMEVRKARIGGYREEAGVESLKIEGFSVTRVSGGTRTKLDPMKLIEMGVTTEMLQDATVVTPTKPFEKITCPSSRSKQETA